jgi:2-polyprenyl-3-methyl-5-hydroxy-6-metoxy-1,4-benzoquinol methylase
VELLACNLCGATDAAFLLSTPDRNTQGSELFTLVQCQRCGLIYMNPQPSAEEQSSHYDADYAPYSPNYGGFEQGRVFTALKSLKDRMYKPRYSEPQISLEHKKVLDFGCGGGRRMETLKKLRPNWEIFGFDVGTNQIENPNIIIGSLADLAERIPEGSLDRIYMANVLEHVSDPVVTLSTLRLLLKTGGEIFIDVPNIGSIKFKVFGKYFSSLDLPRHLYHFNKKTLRGIVEKAGFSVKKLSKSGSAKSTLRSIYYALGIRREKLSATGIFFITKISNLFGNVWDEDELNAIIQKV